LFHAEVRGSSPTSANLAPRPSSCRGLAVGGVMAGGVSLWAVSPVWCFPPRCLGAAPFRFFCRAWLLPFFVMSVFSAVPASGRPPGLRHSSLSLGGSRSPFQAHSRLRSACRTRTARRVPRPQASTGTSRGVRTSSTSSAGSSIRGARAA